MKRAICILLLALVATAIIGIAAGPELWAASGQSPFRGTIPTRTPTPRPTDPPPPPPTKPPSTQPPPTQPPPTSPPTTTPTHTGTPEATLPTSTITETSATATATTDATVTLTEESSTETTITATTEPTEIATSAPTEAADESTSVPPTSRPSDSEKEEETADASPIPTEPAQPGAPSCLGSFSLLLCAGAGLVLIGLIMLVVRRRRAE